MSIPIVLVSLNGQDWKEVGKTDPQKHPHELLTAFLKGCTLHSAESQSASYLVLSNLLFSQPINQT